MNVDQLQRIAADVPAFQGLSTSMMQQLAEAGTLRTFPRGETLCREGDDSTEMYVLLAGELAVTGAGLELSIIESPNIVGEMSLITGLPRCATLEVRSEATVFEITRQGLEELMASHPALAVVIYRNIVTSLCGKLRESNLEVLRSILSV
jgi:CRP-like cAMP-binding protein